MDKCQTNLLKQGTYGFVSEAGEEKIEFKEGFVLYQNDDYVIKNYKIIIDNPNVGGAIYQEQEYLSENAIVTVPFDFANASEELILSFKDGVAVDIALPIKTILADKQTADAKVASRYTGNVALKIATGINLLNVFWKKANDTITKSIVKVYFLTKKDHKYLVLEKETQDYYLAVPNLAFGTYEVEVEEYAGERSVILVKETETLANHPSEIKKAIKKGK